MSKFLIILCLVIIVSCVTVGAINTLSNSNNRPRSVYDTLRLFSSVDLSLDDIHSLADTLRDTFDGNSGGGKFGTPNYKADTGVKWVNVALNAISQGFVTASSCWQIVFYLLRDVIMLFFSLFTVLYGFFVGVPT